MPSTVFNMNRPVHLARRDACAERAVEFLNTPTQRMDTSTRIDHINKVLEILRKAQHHASFAAKSPLAIQPEHDFLHFLRLIAHNVQSAHAMMQHQSSLEGEEGFLCQFLNARPEECVLPAMHYRRRADDIFQGLWHLLQLAHKPYRVLQKANRDELDAESMTRYEVAYASCREELLKRYAIPSATEAGTTPAG